MLVLMTTLTQDPGREIQPVKPQRNATLSPDGKWKSFPKVPNLLQYVSTGVYFGRLKVNGKLIRQSLEATVYSDPLLKLPDFLKFQRKSTRHINGAPLFFRHPPLSSLAH